LQSRAAEADRLTALLEFRNAHPEAPMLVARVIGGSAVGASKTVVLNRGAEDGVKKNMAVITPEGAVGKVLDVYSRESQVLLLTDKESGVGAMLTSTRTQGVVRGTGEPDPIMDYVINDEEVAIGAHIVTSGQDRIFPKDLPLGSVVEAKAGSPFKRIRVRPAARLDRLEEVLILITQAELAPKDAAPPAKAEASRGAPPPSQ
jgi:rod shape-determining protein MreC